MADFNIFGRMTKAGLEIKRFKSAFSFSVRAYVYIGLIPEAAHYELMEENITNKTIKTRAIN